MPDSTLMLAGEKPTDPNQLVFHVDNPSLGRQMDELSFPLMYLDRNLFIHSQGRISQFFTWAFVRNGPIWILIWSQIFIFLRAYSS